MSNWFRTTLVSLLILTGANVASAQNNNDALWSDLNYNLHALLNGAGYGPGHYVQLNSFPVAAGWVRPEGNYSLYVVANNVPQWGPTWTFSRRRLDNAYGVFIDAIDVKADLTPTQRHALEQAEIKWKTSRDKYTAEVVRIQNEWKKESASNPDLNRQDWMRQRVATAVTLKNSALRDFVDYSTKIPADYQTVADMLERFALDSTDLTKDLVLYPPSALDAASQDTKNWPSVRMHSFFGSADQLGQLVHDGDLHANDPTWTRPGFSVGATHHARDEERQMFGGSLSFSAFFFSINAQGHSDSYKIQDSHSEYSLKFEALGLASIAVGPSDAWYSDFLITHYACGPFKKKADGTPAINPQEYFGENGLLSLIPTAVLVAYKPMITVHLDTTDFNEVSQRIAGSAGFSIGPFSIGGGADVVKKHTTIDTTNHNIVLNFDFPDPMILGVVSERKNPGLSCPQ